MVLRPVASLGKVRVRSVSVVAGGIGFLCWSTQMQREPLMMGNGRQMDGPLMITPQLFSDGRGMFFESWNQRCFDEAIGVKTIFVQDNHSRSNRGVLRGLHYQLDPEPQGKLVRCSMGVIFDVAVDLRRSSPTFGQWVGAELSAENRRQLWLPVGFAHGFLTLSEFSEVQYKVSGYWNQSCERSIRWDDPTLGITWPLAEAAVARPQLVERDASAPLLEQVIAAGAVMA